MQLSMQRLVACGRGQACKSWHGRQSEGAKTQPYQGRPRAGLPGPGWSRVSSLPDAPESGFGNSVLSV